MRNLVAAALLPLCVFAAEDIVLRAPRTDGGKPLMQALKLRASSREFAPRPLPAQMLADLLWAAYGVNRPDGKRTAPSAHGKEAVDVYAILPDAAYLYDAKAWRLRVAALGDIRALATTQDFAKVAPLNLVFVADRAKLPEAPEDFAEWTGAEAGAISQNVYLFCASEGLATVVRAGADRPALAKALRLRPEQRILLVQTVGFAR